ncbi:NDR1/HIN1-like protein 13 [Malania oleifera]|uniref:NDR1/HIN1-like protein 13 n=1 Tax=Malania oleifera TaxID=397392 RepID=UPI0025AE2237|nr:NDR1/HIN1-like protein 13 [Malania oleifera]
MTSRANENGEHRAPRPPPSHHHHYYPRPSSSASFKGCCCCLFLFSAFLLLLLLAVVLVVVLAVKPKKPQFDLREVSVQYVGVSPNAPATSAADGVPTASLSLNIGMSFTAVNENKVGIKYGESVFTVMYKGVPLGRASVPGFYQPAHSVRRLNTTVAVDRVNLLQPYATNLMQDALVRDRVELRILGDVGAKIRLMGVTSPAVQIYNAEGTNERCNM